MQLRSDIAFAVCKVAGLLVLIGTIPALGWILELVYFNSSRDGWREFHRDVVVLGAPIIAGMVLLCLGMVGQSITDKRRVQERVEG